MEQKKRTASGFSRRFTIFKKEIPFYIMLIPGVAFALVFSYLPMFGLVMAFQDFSPLRSFTGSEWVGLENFKDMLALPTFWSVIRNTLVISSVKIVLRLVVPLIIALLLNEVMNSAFKRTAQTVFFLPYFLSWVVVSALVWAFLSYDMGLVNQLVVNCGGEPQQWYMKAELWPFLLTFMNVWKGLGYSMVVYLATVAGIDRSLYEAAVIDGASDYQILRKIVIPLVNPAIATVALTTFQTAWASSEASVYYLDNEALKTFSFYISSLSGSAGGIAGVGIGAAATLIMFLPNLIVFIIMQSRVMNTMMHSGIK